MYFIIFYYKKIKSFKKFGKSDLKLDEERGVRKRNLFVSISERKFGADAACGILHSAPEPTGKLHTPVSPTQTVS